MSLPEVQSVLPHRDPFLFLDRVIELTEKRVVGVRTFRPEEPFFKGHFPGRPLVPGVVLIEGLAQTMAYYALVHRKAPNVFLVGVDRARFRGMVAPGDEARFEIDVGDEKLGTLTGKGKVFVGSKQVADGSVIGYAGDAGGLLK